MLTQNLINQWISNGKPFTGAVTLLQLSGTDGRLAAKAARYLTTTHPPSAAFMDRVERAVMVHRIEQAAAVAAEPPPVTTDLADTPADTEPVVIEPQSIAVLRAKLKHAHKRHDEANGRLHAATDNETRYQIAREIMEDITPYLDAGYAQIREYHSTGKEPAAKVEDSALVSAGKDFKKIKSLQPRISRLKKWILDESNSAEIREGFRTELIDKELELEKLKQKYGL